MDLRRHQGQRNRNFDRLRVEVVTRDDGRYLLYYSWPDEPPAEAVSARPSEPSRSDQRPWTPEAGPPGEDDPRGV